MMEHIAVIGAGYMGGGIAQVFAMAGMDVVIAEADPILTATAKPKQDLECMYVVSVWICWLGLKSGVSALFHCGSERF
jgi:predicted dinucleotide-binding enzyme